VLKPCEAVGQAGWLDGGSECASAAKPTENPALLERARHVFAALPSGKYMTRYCAGTTRTKPSIGIGASEASFMALARCHFVCTVACAAQ
jgi:hypothetical protein